MVQVNTNTTATIRNITIIQKDMVIKRITSIQDHPIGMLASIANEAQVVWICLPADHRISQRKSLHIIMAVSHRANGRRNKE